MTDAGAPQAAQTAQGIAAGGTAQILASVPAQSRGPAEQAMHTAFADGLDMVFLVAGIAALAVGILFLVLTRGPATPDVADLDMPPRYIGRHRAPTVTVGRHGGRTGRHTQASSEPQTALSRS